MAILAYHLVRIVHWLLWIGFVGYCLYFVYDRAPHLNQFGHLSYATEFVLFGLPLAAVAVGLLQLYMRDIVYGAKLQELSR
jgi:hypothetical protein